MAGGGNLVDGLGREEVVIGSVAGLQIQNVFITGSLTADAAISGTNVYAQTAMQTDTVVADVTLSGLAVASGHINVTGSITATTNFSGVNFFATGSVQADIFQADVRFSGVDVFATGSLQADVIQADVRFSGVDLFATGSVQADIFQGDVAFSGLNIWINGSVRADRIEADVDLRVAQSIIQPYVTSEGVIIDSITAVANLTPGQWVAGSAASGTTPSLVAKPLPTGAGRGALGISLTTTSSGTASYPEILIRGFYRGLIAEATVNSGDIIAPGAGAGLNTAVVAAAGSARGIAIMGAGSEGTILAYLF